MKSGRDGNGILGSNNKLFIAKSKNKFIFYCKYIFHDNQWLSNRLHGLDQLSELGIVEVMLVVGPLLVPNTFVYKSVITN